MRNSQTNNKILYLSLKLCFLICENCQNKSHNFIETVDKKEDKCGKIQIRDTFCCTWKNTLVDVALVTTKIGGI